MSVAWGYIDGVILIVVLFLDITLVLYSNSFG